MRLAYFQAQVGKYSLLYALLLFELLELLLFFLFNIFLPFYPPLEFTLLFALFGIFVIYLQRIFFAFCVWILKHENRLSELLLIVCLLDSMRFYLPTVQWKRQSGKPFCVKQNTSPNISE